MTGKFKEWRELADDQILELAQEYSTAPMAVGHNNWEFGRVMLLKFARELQNLAYESAPAFGQIEGLGEAIRYFDDGGPANNRMGKLIQAARNWHTLTTNTVGTCPEPPVTKKQIEEILERFIAENCR